MEGYSITTLEKSPNLRVETIRLIEESLHYEDCESFEVDFYPLVSKRNAENCHILLYKGTVVAHIGVLERELEHNNITYPVLLLGGIAVQEKFRGKGLFLKLFREVENKYRHFLFYILWSNLDKLYKKINFFECGALEQTSDLNFTDSQISESFTKTKLSKLKKSDLSRIKQLYNEQYSTFFKLKRDSVNWHELESIKSSDLFIYRENVIEGYIFYGKGQDLRNIIHEYAYNKNSNFPHDEIEKCKIWRYPTSLNNKNLLYACLLKLKDESLLKNFIQTLSNKSVTVLCLEKHLVRIIFNGNIFEISHEDFIRGIFGPNYLEEFKEFTRPLWFSGLDSI